MRFSVTLALIGCAAAQTLPLSLFGINLSAPCQQAILGALTNGSFAQCSSAASLAPLLTASNSSVIPVLDNFMSNICYSQPCSNETLSQTAASLTAGCQADIANRTISNTTIQAAFGLYPLIREVLCLKTSQPYTAQSYNGTLGAPPIPITQYNSTGGYFCVSSILTQLTAYFGANLTLPYVTSIVTQQNSTAVNLVQSIQPNILCNECLFGAVDVINVAFPAVSNISVNAVFRTVGISASVPDGTTLAQAMDGECAYVPLMVSSNGTLPQTISVSIVNSTFPFPITPGRGAA